MNSATQSRRHVYLTQSEVMMAYAVGILLLTLIGVLWWYDRWRQG